MAVILFSLIYCSGFITRIIFYYILLKRKYLTFLQKKNLKIFFDKNTKLWTELQLHSIQFLYQCHTLCIDFLSLQNSLTIELKYSTWQVHMIFLTRIKLQSLLWILIDICAFLNPVFFLLFETQAAEYLSDDPLSLASSQWIQNYSEVVSIRCEISPLILSKRENLALLSFLKIELNKGKTFVIIKTSSSHMTFWENISEENLDITSSKVSREFVI